MAGLAAAVAVSNGRDRTTAAAPTTSNPWLTMAAAAQLDYLSRMQSTPADRSTYAALAAQGISSNYEAFSRADKNKKADKGNHGLDALKLPSDTEIIKYTSSSTGPKVPGTTNRGRKKTISLDPTPNVMKSSGTSTASFPSGKFIRNKHMVA